MIPEEITEETLREIGIEDADKALRSVRELSGQGVTDDDLAPLLPLLLKALAASPDPDRALGSFSRWFAAIGGRYSHLQTLIRHPVALELFCLVTGSSQYFADLLVRQPEYFEILANPGVRGGAKSAPTLYRELSALVDICQLPELKRDALRRWKAREMLRIGVRDLIGLADMPSTAREFSNLADACAQKACDIAAAQFPLTASTPALPFAVIAMGKLGGQELNYSSDIDLMFLHGDALPERIELVDGRRQETPTYLTRFAEAVVKILSEESANGHVFRVDMRLRPEGRFGPLVRSLASYRAYYESWAENWERQALLKARFIAGDRALGETYMAMIQPFVYRRQVTSEFLADIRANKRRIEQKCALEDQTFTNIKTGYGGIRDVEFIVQLLQLEYGGKLPRLRTQNTLTAIERLRHYHLLMDEEAFDLYDDYVFLRNLEHRLQLLHGFQTQTLPPESDTRERAKVARRMGYLNAEGFEKAVALRRERLHAHLETLFYGRESVSDTASVLPLDQDTWADFPDLLDNLDSPAAQERLKERLRAAGFRNLPAALNALQLPMRGNEFGEMPPDTPIEFKAIAPRLMTLLAHSPDPDAGIAGIEALALAVPNRAQLYAAFDDSPRLMERLVRLAAVSPPLFKRLTRHQEWLEGLFDEGEAISESADWQTVSEKAENATATLYEELTNRVQGAKRREAKLEALARFTLRETLRIGAREVWEEADATDTMASLTALAEATLQALLDVCAEALIAAHSDPEFAREALSRVAIIGLGKLGGAELSYGSDWDVVFGYDEGSHPADKSRSKERFDLATAVVERVNNAGKDLALYGATIEIDLRLRPWGRKGGLVYAPSGFIQYFRTEAATWERQAALKARCVAGNAAVGKRLMRIFRAVSFGRGVTLEEDAAVQAMKRRIESERLKVGERETDLKLGYGGLSDVEWLAQRLQLRNGPKRAGIRVSNTLRALTALSSARLLDNAEADVLAATYVLLTRVRNALWLQTGSSQDALPADAHQRRILAHSLGYTDTATTTAEARLWEDLQAHKNEVRRIFQQRFYEAVRSVTS